MKNVYYLIFLQRCEFPSKINSIEVKSKNMFQINLLAVNIMQI